MQLNVTLANVGGWEALVWPGSTSRLSPPLLLVAILYLTPSDLSFVGQRTASPSVSAPPPDPRTTTPHTMVEDDISSPLTPPHPVYT